MIRRFSVKVGGKDRVVELEAGDDGTRVVVDGVEKAIELTRVEDGAWLVRTGTSQALAYVDGENGKVTVGLKRGGDDVVVVAAEVVEARSARVAALAQRARGTAAEGPLTVRSP